MTDKEILQLQGEYSEAKREIYVLKDVCESVKSILMKGHKIGVDVEVRGKFIAGWRPSLYGPRYKSIDWVQKNNPGMYKMMVENGIIDESPEYFAVKVKLSEV
jgi:hypothetical protein